MKKPQKGEIRKPTKTLSGITPVAVMLPFRDCEHGECIYCPNMNVPKSYTPKSPVVMRAQKLGFDAYKQVKARIKSFELMNHSTQKIELIIMGGTFLEYPDDFKYKFIKGCYDGLNNKKSKDLSGAQNLNEVSKHRCVALCVETRPDVCVKYIDEMRKWGVTRIELGVQIIDDTVYKKVKRGHSVSDVIYATRKLKDAGFKVGYHIMPGLPFSNFDKDLRLFKELFSNEDFKPDQLKIYPCQVMPCSVLEEIYWKGEYKPYTKEETKKILIKMLKLIPRYCRVMRVMREIPPVYLTAGVVNIDLRREVEEELKKQGVWLNEIRWREIGFAKGDVNLDLDLKITKYKASGGDEYFLEVVNKDDILFGLLRLRIKNKCAIIREVHVYGKSLDLGEKIKIASQHKGFGKLLMKKAEEISMENKVKKISVISGIGVREYYKKLGYCLEGTYMVKFL
jgi:elongator complex protein 3